MCGRGLRCSRRLGRNEGCHLGLLVVRLRALSLLYVVSLDVRTALDDEFAPASFVRLVPRTFGRRGYATRRQRCVVQAVRSPEDGEGVSAGGEVRRGSQSRSRRVVPDGAPLHSGAPNHARGNAMQARPAAAGGEPAASASFEEFGGRARRRRAVVGFLYALSFIVISRSAPVTGALLSALFLLLFGLTASAALSARYQRLRRVDPGFALWALLLGMAGSLGRGHPRWPRPGGGATPPSHPQHGRAQPDRPARPAHLRRLLYRPLRCLLAARPPARPAGRPASWATPRPPYWWCCTWDASSCWTPPAPSSSGPRC